MTQANAKADEAFTEARKFFEQSRHDDALKALDTSIAHQPTARAYRIKGYIHKLNGRLDDAAAALEEALEIDINDHGSLSLLAEIRVAEKDIQQAIGLYILAIEAAPANVNYKENFLTLAGTHSFAQYNQQTADALVSCLKTPEVECAAAQILWLSLFETTPGVRALYSIRQTATGPTFDARKWSTNTDLTPLDTPLFINGLQRLAIYHPAFEQFLTHLRRHLLIEIGAQNLSPLHMRLAAALGHYCFFTEYMFNLSEDEKNAADALGIEIATQPTIATACIYACYAPLAALKNATDIARILQTGGDEAFNSLATVQIAEPIALEADKNNIDALTDIGDGVSALVRAQYEEFPYPRWKKLGSMSIASEVATALSQPKMDILVAGCGTGREALNVATTFKDANVLAIDLSLTSLSYARSKARYFGVTNAEFKQADITKLSALPQRFDYITSSGVLHHLADPESGLQILAGLLKPDGVMRIALYSELGRKAVVAARAAIEKGGYTGSAESMRRFRQDLPKLLSTEMVIHLMGFGDFYHMSMFRDFLFHEQEHRFDIPRIARALDSSGLQFIKFNVKTDIETMYRKTYPDGAHTFDRWHALEQKNPQLFREMYSIWCKKKI